MKSSRHGVPDDRALKEGDLIQFGDYLLFGWLSRDLFRNVCCWRTRRGRQKAVANYVLTVGSQP
jgi:hypothetical protein